MNAPTPMEPKAFEATLRELEQIVQQLQAGQLPLDESLKAFERGITLYRQCQGLLEQAELRIRQVGEAELAGTMPGPADAS